MTADAAHAKPAARPSAVDAFIACAEARALLWQAGEFDLHEAVDELQAAAERSGLVADIGQDEVQRIMAEAFAAVREDLDAVPDPGRQPIEAIEERPRKHPASTLKAAEYLAQQNNPDRMRAWLAKHTASDRQAILEHLERQR